MKYTISITNNGDSYSCSGDESILHGMVRLGRKGIPVGCRGGGCGVCRVRVLSGSYTAGRMSSCHIDDDDLKAGEVLACKINPSSDLEIEVVGKIECRFSSTS